MGLYTSNRLTSVTDPLSNSTLYIYDASNRISKVVDRENKMIGIVYDASSRVTDLFLGLYNRTTSSITWQYRWYTILGYANTRTRTVTDANNVASTFTLDERGTPKNITGPLAGGSQSCCSRPGSESVESQWDAERNKVVAKDAKGYAWRYTYDFRGNEKSRLDPMGNTSTSSLDNRDTGTLFVSLLTKSTNFRGYSTTYTYDAKGNLIMTTNPDGSTSSRTYDSAGFMKTSQDFRHYQTNYTYDSHGWLTQVKNPLGFVTTYGYDSLGRQINVTTPLGLRTQYVFDALDRRTKVTDPTGNSTSSVYNARGDLTKVIDPNGYTTQFQINVTLTSKSKTIEAGGNSTVFGYDTRGNLVTVTDPRLFATTYQYDAYSRRINETRPGGNYTRFTYDRNGNAATRSDANGNMTTYGYDKLNRATKVTYPGAVVVTNQYDANGNVVQVVGFGYTRTETWDKLDRPTSTVDNYGSFTKTFGYQYDADSHRTRLNYSDGTYATYFHNKASWLTYENHSESLSWSFSYDNDGRRTTLAYPNGVLTTTKYDKASRVTNVWTNRSGSVLESFAYTHDKAGNRLSMTEANGSSTQYLYDRLYRLTEALYDGIYPVNYTYDADGNRLKLDQGFNQQMTYVLRPTANAAVSWSQSPPSGQNFDKVDETVSDGDATYVYAPIHSVTPIDKYEFQDLPAVTGGRIDYVRVKAVARYEFVAQSPPPLVPSGTSIKLLANSGTSGIINLDGIYRTYSYTWTTKPATGLAWTKADLDALQAGVQAWGTDKELHVTQVYVEVSVTWTRTTTDYSYGKDDQILTSAVAGGATTTYAYDKNGNMRTRVSGSATTTYAYDIENRLTSVTTSAGTTSYAYSADGRRLKRVSGGTTTYFGNDPASPSRMDDTIEEYTSTGTKIATYVHGISVDELLGYKTTVWYSYQRDALGSVTRLTDSAGTTSSTYRYDAFGAIRWQIPAARTRTDSPRGKTMPRSCTIGPGITTRPWAGLSRPILRVCAEGTTGMPTPATTRRIGSTRAVVGMPTSTAVGVGVAGPRRRLRQVGIGSSAGTIALSDVLPEMWHFVRLSLHWRACHFSRFRSDLLSALFSRTTLVSLNS